MPAPASVPTWNIEQLRFPKALDGDARTPALHARLRAGCAKLWAGGVIEVPWVAWSEPLAAALTMSQREGQLAPGIEQAERALAREAHGLSLADARSSTERGSRVSRLVLASNDGTERFYRQIEHLLRTHGPRVLALRLDAGSGVLSGVVDKPGGVVRALLVEHKASVARVLLALCEVA
jgi:hypothetical protein